MSNHTASDSRLPAAGRQSVEHAASDRHLIIPVFLPHMGCTHRCVFCNQRTITGSGPALPSPEHLQRTVQTFLAFSGKRPKRTQIAFFGGNFLGLAPGVIRSMLSAAERFVTSGQVDGIRFSTRPDTIDARRLELIEPFSIQTVELGAQSMQDAVLKQSGRGHSVQDTFAAVELLRRKPVEIGLQLMIGLPGETDTGCYRSAVKAAGLRPDFIRLYPTIVLAGSPLADRFRAGNYRPLSLQQCLVQVKQLVLFFTRRRIPIIRIGLPALDVQEVNNRVLAGPYHPAFGHLVHCELFFDMARELLGDGSSGRNLSTVTFRVHPRSVSRLRGLRNRNLVRLHRQYSIGELHTRSDPQLPLDGLRLAGTGQMLTYADLRCDI